MGVDKQRRCRKMFAFGENKALYRITGKIIHVLKGLRFECINHPTNSPNLTTFIY